FAYVTNNKADHLTAFAVDGRSGQLTRLNDVPVRGRPGADRCGPSYLYIDAAGRFMLVANYRGHNVEVFALRDDGRIGDEVANHSAGDHAHSIQLDAANRF